MISIATQKPQTSYRKTQKKKNELSDLDKSKLWDVFDIDTKTILADNPEPSNIECVYTKDTDKCNLCKSSLMIMEDGFPTCVNSSCGVMYTNVLDFSPEWRFYGSEDKNSSTIKTLLGEWKTPS